MLKPGSIFLFGVGLFLLCCYPVLAIDLELSASNSNSFNNLNNLNNLNSPQKTALVLGYFSRIKNKTWQNAQVGFGVQGQLKQLIFDLPQYALKEEKLQIKQARAQVMDGKEASWLLKPSQISSTQLQQKAQQVNVDAIFWVEVLKFGRLKSEVFAGPFSSVKKKTNLKLKICRYLVNAQAIDCEVGLAGSKRRSSAFIYSGIDASNKKAKQARFDASLVGKLSYAAMLKAIKVLNP